MARILILTQPYVPDPSPTGQHLHDTATALAGRGHEVLVLTSNRGYEEPSRRYPSRETRGGVEVRRLPFCSFGKGRVLARVAGASSFTVQAAVRGLLCRRPDAILVSTSPPLCPIAALVVFLLRGVPFCYWIHDLHPDWPVRLGMLDRDARSVRLMNWMNRWVLAHAKRIVVLDRFMNERVQRKLDVAAKTVVIPPWPHNECGERIEHSRNPWRKEHVGGGRRVVMYSGNHTPAHPLDTVLQAALRLRDEEGLELLFVGGGTSKQEVDAIIERERPGNIRSLPYQPLEILRYSLAAADVHLVSMGSEVIGISHPCKIYGALAAGRPLLLVGPDPCHATDVMGEHAVGWRVAHGDVDGAVEALREIRQAPCGRLEEMGRTAQELVRRHYSRDALCGRLCDEMEAALGLPMPPAAAAPTEARQPSVSVLIPVRNAEATIEAALDSVLSQDYEGSVEVIVADGSDTPATSELVRRRYPTVRLVPNPERTIGFGSNAALRAATGEVAVRCDAHTALPPGYLRRAVETLARTGAANVGGRQRPVGDGPFERAVSMAMTSPLGAGGARHRVGGAEGPADTVYLGVFRREALDAVGGYDPGLERNGDYELNWRLRQRGETVWFDPGLSVTYRPRGTLRALARQYFDYGRWKRVVLRRHPPSVRWRQIASPAIVLALAGGLVLALVGAPWPALALLSAYVPTLVGAAAVMVFRQRDPAALLVPLVLGAMHLAWGSGFFLPARNRAQDGGGELSVGGRR